MMSFGSQTPVALDASCGDDDCAVLVSADPPSLFQGFSQPGPITLTLAGPVGTVTVVGRGAIQCSSGQYGTLVGYDASGAELGRVSLQLINPADCSPADNPDDVTFGAQATLVTSQPMASAVILPMSPLEFPVLGVPGGHASARYAVSVGAGTFEDAPPTLRVNCPASATRGDPIACTIGLSVATLPFTVTQLTTTTFADEAFVVLSLDVPPPVSAGEVYKLEGPAVSPSTLSATATVDWHGQTLSLTKSAKFLVDPRPAELGEYVMTLRPELAGPGLTSEYPSIWSGGGSLGRYTRRSPDWTEARISTSASGPNKGLSYVTSIPGIPSSLINLTFAIFSGDPWYDAHPIQAGKKNGLGETICSRSSIDQLRLLVERHEGVTMADNSHFGIDQAQLRKWKLARVLGALVTTASGNPAAIKQALVQAMAQAWDDEDAFASMLQAAFDSTDTPAIYASLGCNIYLD